MTKSQALHRLELVVYVVCLGFVLAACAVRCGSPLAIVPSESWMCSACGQVYANEVEALRCHDAKALRLVHPFEKED